MPSRRGHLFWGPCAVGSIRLHAREERAEIIDRFVKCREESVGRGSAGGQTAKTNGFISRTSAAASQMHKIGISAGLGLSDIYREKVLCNDVYIKVIGEVSIDPLKLSAKLINL